MAPSMARKLSSISPDWWDYTTLDREILDEAAKLTAEEMLGLSRPGFEVVFYDTLEDFYLDLVKAPASSVKKN